MSSVVCEATLTELTMKMEAAAATTSRSDSLQKNLQFTSRHSRVVKRLPGEQTENFSHLKSSQATGKASMKAWSLRIHADLLSTDSGTWNKFRIRIFMYFSMGELPGPPGGLLGLTLRVDHSRSSSAFCLAFSLCWISFMCWAC